MKYVVVFMLVCVALAAAAPQFITTWPGLVGTTVGNPWGVRTLVAGPSTVLAGGIPTTIGGRIITTNGLFGGNIVV